jgi:hypothetical protein
VLEPDGGAWHELVLRARRPSAEEAALSNGFPACTLVAEDAETLELLIEPALVEGFHYSPLTPSTVVVWEPEGQGGLLAGEGRRVQFTLKPDHIPLRLDLPVARAKAEGGCLLIDLSFASCTEYAARLCKPERRRWDLFWKCAAGPAHPVRLVGGAIGTH